MPAQRLREFLDQQGVKYVTLRHSPAFTAQEIAAKAHVPGKEMAKTVMIKLDGKMALTVLPASYRVDFDMLEKAAGVSHVSLASEDEFRNMFPDCELGAMPPFGKLFGMETYVSAALAEDEEIVFNAGTHTELIRMRYRDFERLVEPTVLEFATVV